MQVTARTDYGLRIMIFVASKGEALSTIAEIAAAYQISKSHLMKIVRELVAKGYLRAVRGKHGGIRIGKPAEQIRMGQIVRDLEPDFGLVECLRTNNSCVITPVCLLRNALLKALDAFLKSLDEHTLADVVSNAAPIKRLLSIRQD